MPCPLRVGFMTHRLVKKVPNDYRLLEIRHPSGMGHSMISIRALARVNSFRKVNYLKSHEEVCFYVFTAPAKTILRIFLWTSFENIPLQKSFSVPTRKKKKKPTVRFPLLYTLASRDGSNKKKKKQSRSVPCGLDL
ncbi:hypothetical protein CEXT_458801 [Caerostris extrusa]|uniref:Uncharacterized protein n=1 Tax=Caerostris extrusa TaxID=172846 RepID=A0AAV4V361_CAEEX|nr:hypothetical protein CEXT_458801 [Caerostris extrusa]